MRRSKERASERRASEKGTHRASMLYLQGQNEIFAALQKSAATMTKDEEPDSDDDDESYDISGIETLKEYDPKTDGPYVYFYVKHHKAQLDARKLDWELRTGRRVPSKTRVPSKC